MKTQAVRIYGKQDLRLETFELPPMRDDEILAKVITDSICMSSYKAAMQGADHKRVPDDVADNPTIIGHEFAGEIVAVGKKWQDKFFRGMKFSVQPALNYKDSLNAPGYSYRYIGGDATTILIPREVMEMDCLLPYEGPGFFPASLAEPFSCVLGAFHASYHIPPGTYHHDMGIRQGGNLALLAAAGPMGLAAINFAIHQPRKPSVMVVTDIDQARLDRAATLFPPGIAAEQGIKLHYVNTADVDDPEKTLKALTGGKGYDDVFVFAPVAAIIEIADSLLRRDGCLNFFAGPPDPDFSARLNFYNVHYEGTHITGTSGGNNKDMAEALQMFSEGLDPSGLITHIGGLDAVIPTTLHLPDIPGGKKLIYTHLSLPLTAIEDFAGKGREDPLFAKLDEITRRHNGLWSVEAEEYLLAHGPRMNVG
ncbi:MAG: zinc-binding dehydrogenase [Chlorobi bacterium]|nr:zinc-binding dehydrogenase [Chlorobiota bacterium]